jgi:hypothetical protein
MARMIAAMGRGKEDDDIGLNDDLMALMEINQREKFGL